MKGLGLQGCASGCLRSAAHVKLDALRPAFAHIPVCAQPRCRASSPVRAQTQEASEPEQEHPRGIFETYPQSAETVTILDARDALETCGELTGKGRDSCFAQFGCSSERVTTYFAAVEAMERAFEREEEGDEDDYVPDTHEHQLPNPLDFVWRS